MSSDVAPAKVHHVRIDEGKVGQRIDNFLLGYLKGVPKSRIYRLLRKGEVRANGARIKPEYRLVVNDDLRIPPVTRAPATPVTRAPTGAARRVEEAIFFENDSLLIMNKPAGLAVHGGSGLSFGAIEALRSARPDAPFLELAHRLDRDTSGCLIIAKRRSVLRRLHAALRERRVGKRYLCLVRDPWMRGVRIDAPLRRDEQRSGERMVTVDEESGRMSRTSFEPLDHWSVGGHGGSLMRATIDTGRTHQIRVHAAQADHPISGDEKYGDREHNRVLKSYGLKRMFLHANEISIPPDVLGDRLTCTAPLPDALSIVLTALGMAARDATS
ncbi:MAG: 23S rRNA pseudouridine955/2504/2580 synthase [Gammaproteobacteria bacterium]